MTTYKLAHCLDAMQKEFRSIFAVLSTFQLRGSP